MLAKIKKYQETNKILKKIEIIIMLILIGFSFISFIIGFYKINDYHYKEAKFLNEVTLFKDKDSECDEDVKTCTIKYSNGSDTLIKEYKDPLKVSDTLKAYKYLLNDGTSLCFEQKEVQIETFKKAYKEKIANKYARLFNAAIACFIMAISILIIYKFSKVFSLYEKCWFISIMFLATLIAILFPEESTNGISGIIIMFLYLLDTFLNILCELLISKQSRYNFLVSIAVEIVEIITCIVLMYRFATIATTLFFWLPIDILSYLNWSKHKDENDDKLTAVRKLKGYEEVLIIIGIIIWTLVVGYFISGLNIQTDFFNGNERLATIITYIDACASAVGVANGLFIFFRLQEQWIAWYICALLETIINIMSGQYVLLVLKLGYFTNTTYGYLKWSSYIKEHKQKKTIF